MNLTHIFQRWRALDAALASEDGLNLSELAKQCKVDEKTIRRDLEVFRELGQNCEARRRRREDGTNYRWHYEHSRPLFTANVGGSEYREVTLKDCAALITNQHYTGKLPRNAKLTFADMQHLPNRRPLACCVFSPPIGPFENAEGILELSRLVRLPDYDRPLTKLVSKALGHIRAKKSAELLISLADVQEDHHGGIYQACSWIYGGMRGERLDGFTIDGKFVPARTCNHRYGTSSARIIEQKHGGIPHYDAGKHFYWKPLTKTGARLAVNMDFRSLPYPQSNHGLKAGHKRKGVVSSD